MLTIEFNRRLAYIGGVVTPLAETIRRWSTWQQTPANFFDDYLLAAFLIYGAWRIRRNVHEGQRFLIAAWPVAGGFSLRSRSLEFVHHHVPFALAPPLLSQPVPCAAF